MLFRQITGDKPVKITAIALGFAVVALIAVYAGALSQPGSSMARTIAYHIGLSRDGSMGEIVNYGLAFTAFVLLFLSSVENRSRILLFLSVLMAFVWVDDAAGYHERVGLSLAEAYDVPAFLGLRQRDTGEVIAWSAAGAVLGLGLLLSLIRRRPGDLGALVLVSAGFALLVLCGMVVDLIHVVVPPRLEDIFAVIEDGGEMVAMAYIAGISLGMARNGQTYYDAVAVDRESGVARPRAV